MTTCDDANLEFDVRYSADGDVSADVGVLAVFAQEVVAAREDVAQPLEDVGVVGDPVLHQLLRDGEDHLRTVNTRDCTIMNV